MRLSIVAAAIMLTLPAHAQPKWVTSWAASVQGPYPIGNATAQPELRFAFPEPQARDQTFRLILKPSLWASRMRLRFSNVFGTKPLILDGAFLGLQASSAALVPGSNRPVLFGGKTATTLAPGAQIWSDPVTLPWLATPSAPEWRGRKIAASFHVVGESGPMTWHAKGLQTSYITGPGKGALGGQEGEGAYPNSTKSRYFLDALDVMAPGNTGVLVCFGDSIIDGTSSTLNGDDRWPDVLLRRLQAAGRPMAVVNAGIGGNQVVGPADYGPDKPFPGGPAALSRLERDVLSLSGVSHVIWLEGINDLGSAGSATPGAIREGMVTGVTQIRAKLPGVTVLGATLTSIRDTTSEAHKAPQVEQNRRPFNDAMQQNDGLFDAVVDFDRATLDPQTLTMRPEFIPGSTIGGPGEGLHPNRAGYMAMSEAIDLRLLTTRRAKR